MHFQKAIVSAILHGYFLTETGGVQRSMEDLPAYLRALGKLGGNIFISLFDSLSPEEIAFLTSEFDEAIQKSRWFASKHAQTSFPSSLEFKRWLRKTGRGYPKVQS